MRFCSRCELSPIDVATAPGITRNARRCGAFTRKSPIKLSVKPLTANLAEAYAVCANRVPRLPQNPLQQSG